MICIFSLGRSGSTWLAKIFDSHPDVFYLHEPDISDRGLDLLPYWFGGDPTEEQVEAAKTYLARLESVRTPRSAGSLPLFRKHYRSLGAERVRRTIIFAAKGAERATSRELMKSFRIPDLTDRGRPKHVVMKLVTGLGRAEILIRAAAGRIKPVHLIRHPCGYVNSVLRGVDIGALHKLPPLGRLLDTRSAKRLGAKPSEIDVLSDVEQLAWNWLLSNAEAVAAVDAADGDSVIYDELARDPTRIMRNLFERTGIDWVPQVDAFLRETSTREGGYFSVYRRRVEATNHWRSQLNEDVIAKVRAIVTRDPVGQIFFG